jgi:hypothetical protein
MVVIGLVVGAAVGLVVFQASQTSGYALFALAGATAGVAASLVAVEYTRAARLSEIKVIVPQLSELTFVVTRDSQVVAWRLFVETATRVSTQPLDREAGLLREALTSLHSLFEIVRGTLQEAHPSRPNIGPTVEHLAITMLNHEIRPFLARWHPALLRWERTNPADGGAAWPEAPACRDDLNDLQERLREYATSFGRLAGVTDPDAALTPRPTAA